MLDLADSAILQMGAACYPLKFRYSKEELIRLKESPLSLKRSDYLDTAYDKSVFFNLFNLNLILFNITATEASGIRNVGISLGGPPSLPSKMAADPVTILIIIG